MYKVGSPFWKTVARLGLPVSLRVDVRHDAEANVFIATSPDLDGLVVEASTLDDLVQETNGAVEMLMSEYVHGSPRAPEAWYNFHGVQAVA
jgi:predicted RNase H-like HicB family nuclease